MPRIVDFVTDSTGLHWLPHPTSWTRGLLTHKWLEYWLGPAKQASPDYFKALTERFGLRTITEADNGAISVTLPNPPAQELNMNVSSPTIEADLRDFAARLSRVEERLAARIAEPVTPAPAPAALPVDKMQIADYGRNVSTMSAEMDDDSEDEEVPNPMGNLTHSQVSEVVAAFDDLLRWKESPNPTMSPEMQAYIEEGAMRRLIEAMRPLEQVVKASER